MSAPALVRPLVRPWWRRARLWVGLAVVVVVGAVVVGALGTSPGRRYDPSSARQDGSRALARVLAGYGVPVTRTTSVSRAAALADGRSVVVVEPDDYSSGQLRRLRDAAALLVVVRPGPRATHAVARDLDPVPDAGDSSPSCSAPGAVAAGEVSFPSDVQGYTGSLGGQRCYDGALVTGARLAVLGSADVLRNDNLADRGVAAFDVNALTDSRQVRSVVWLLPGADASGPGPASVWDLFPGGAYRVFWWAAAVLLLLALWRGRRLGGVVAEPLPVAVRAAELVEGHGRLYLRSGARDRAAAALRDATLRRLAGRLGLPKGASVEQVATAVAARTGRTVAELAALLGGPAPADDAALVRLAHELDDLSGRITA